MTARMLLPAALAALSFAAALGAVAAGCGTGSGTARRAAPAEPPTYVYVVDWSGSTDEVRRRLLGMAALEIEELPDDTRVVFFRMGSRTEEFYDGRVVGMDTDGLVAALAKGGLETDPSRGTDFSKMAASLERFSRRFRGTRFLVRVLTDGGDDRPGQRAEYERAAASFCADRRLSDLAFYGPVAGTREAIRAAFAGAGPRLRILDMGQELAP